MAGRIPARTHDVPQWKTRRSNRFNFAGSGLDQGTILHVSPVRILPREAAKLGLSIDSSGQLLRKEYETHHVAVHETTGQKIRWNGRHWVNYNTGEPYA